MGRSLNQHLCELCGVSTLAALHLNTCVGGKSLGLTMCQQLR